MSNCQRFEVPHIELVGWHLVSTALLPILRTIVFMRNFNLTEPRELYNDNLKLCYCVVNDLDTEQKLTSKSKEFVLWLQRRPTHSGSLKLTFHDQCSKNGRTLFESMGSGWEEWTISVSVSDKPEAIAFDDVKKTVESCIGFVVRSVSRHPCPLPFISQLPLARSFRISIVMENKAAEMFNALHRALQDINTTSLLR